MIPPFGPALDSSGLLDLVFRPSDAQVLKFSDPRTHVDDQYTSLVTSPPNYWSTMGLV